MTLGKRKDAKFENQVLADAVYNLTKMCTMAFLKKITQGSKMSSSVIQQGPEDVDYRTSNFDEQKMSENM